MGIIKRTVGFNVPVNVTTSLCLVRNTLCRALIRSNLEYCSSVWSPGTTSDVKTIESIQRAATRCIPNYLEIQYEQRDTILHFIHYRTDVKFQIWYIFLIVLNVTMTYPGIIK